MPDLERLLNIAKSTAQQASELIMGYYRAPSTLEIMTKGQGEGDVTTADLQANALILQNLQSACGTSDFAYISEETADDPKRLAFDWVWIIDPLDGTKGFIERSGEFGVHIGLVYRQRPVLGVVAFPAMGEIYYAIANHGAWGESADGTITVIHTSRKTDLAQMIAIASSSHRSPAMEFVLTGLPKQSEQKVGGLGGKWVAIARGKADYYLTICDQSAPKDWDFCAPEIILQEAGGKATYFNGAPILYNRPDLRQLSPIVASNGLAHEALCWSCQEGLANWQKTQEF